MAITFNHNDQVYVKDGNLGVGTDNPTYKLTVQGSVNLAGTGAYLRWNSGDMQISNDGSYKMGFYTYNTTAAALVNRMVIDTSGNVGIGDTAPSFILDVNNTSSRVRFKAATGDSNLELSSIAGRDWLIQSKADGVFRIYDEDAAAARLSIDTSGNIQLPAYGAGVLTTDSAGNVGVSTGYQTQSTADGRYVNVTGDTMTGQLIIQNTGNFTAAKFKGTAADGYGQINVENDLGTGLILGSMGSTKTGTFFDNARYIGATSGELVLKTYSSTDGHMKFLSGGQNERMRITYGGNVGIGTTSPLQTFDLDGVAYFRGGTAADFGSGNTPTDTALIIDEGDFIYTKDNTYLRKLIGKTTGDIIQIGESGTSLIDGIELKPGSGGSGRYIAFFDNNTESARFTAGNLGIGTTSPSSKLHVVGDVILGEHRIIDLPSFNMGAASVTDEYLVVCKQAPSGGGVDASGIQGRISFSRGSSGSFNNSQYIDINIQMSLDSGNVNNLDVTQFELYRDSSNAFFSQLEEIDIDGTKYVALKARASGGGETNHFYFEGSISDASDTNILSRVRASDSTVTVTDPQPTGFPITPYITKNQDGNVGIGTTDPSTNLEVAGAVKVTDSASGVTIGGVGHASLRLNRASTSYDNNILFNTNGDTKFRIWQDGNADYLYIRDDDNATNMVTFKKGGNVGIGTTDPSRDLHIVKSNDGGQVRFQIINTSNTADSTSVISIYNGGANGGDPFLHWKIDVQQDWSMGIDNSDGDKLKISKNFGPGTNDYLTVDTSGNVGIGTTSPGAKLEVDGTGKFDAIELVNGGGSTTRGLFSDGTQGEVTLISPERVTVLFDSNNNDTTSFFAVKKDATDPSNATELFRVNSSGNVGIGTTDPGAKLTVSGSATGLYTNVLLANTNDTDGDATGIGFSMLDNMTYVKGGIFFERTDTGGRGSIHIATTNTTDGTNAGLSDARLTVDKDGNVGIGTDDPASKLHINGVTQASGFKSNNFTATTSGFSIESGDAAVTTYRFDADRFRLYSGNYGEIFSLKENGSLGLGVTNPSQRLTVDGNIQGYDDLYLGADKTSGATILQLNNYDSALTDAEDVQNVIKMQGRYWSGNNSQLIQTEIRSVKERSDGNGDSGLAFATQAGGNAPAEKMRIAHDGNVGIGTTSPQDKLHVTGTVRGDFKLEGGYSAGTTDVAKFTFGYTPRGGDTNNKNIAFISAYNTTTDSTSGGYLSIGTRATNGSLSEHIRISNGGNVGIGTTGPATKLHILQSGTAVSSDGVSSLVVQKSAAAATAAAINIVSGDSAEASLRFGDTTDQSMGALRYLNDVDAFSIVTNNNEQVRITSGGNVGIGTTNPTTKLEVSSSGAEGILISKDTATTSNSGRLFFETDTVSEGFSFLNSNGIMTIRSQAQAGATSGNVRVAIDGSGNVGIGTTAPQQALHIKGATNGLMMLEGDNDNGIAGCYYKTEDTDDTMNRTKGFFGFQGNNTWGLGYFTMWLDNVGDNGTVTASEERFRWERDGDFHADGDVIAYSTTTPSDIRLKTDIETIESASEKVSKLRGVEYTWSKGKLAGQREIGLIAQEVEAVVPEVVKEKKLPLWDDSGESYKTVDYDKLVALLIESNKEMQEEIKKLKERLDGFTK